MKSFLRRLVVEEDAPTMAEYGLLLVFVALLVFASVLALGQGISTFFAQTGEELSTITIPTIP
jgi:Flp pilus assembly pilin Flp